MDGMKNGKADTEHPADKQPPADTVHPAVDRFHRVGAGAGRLREIDASQQAANPNAHGRKTQAQYLHAGRPFANGLPHANPPLRDENPAQPEFGSTDNYADDHTHA
jgi:hypothetical protein